MEEDLSFRGNDPGASQYGNFINYYQFHPPDTRIRSLPNHVWDPPGSDIECCVALDIGCNSGELTTELHSFLGQNSTWKSVSLLGIDIDPTLITRANGLKKEHISFECLNIMTEDANEKLQDYLDKIGKEKFDVIFCFSVTMWIHMNFGDEGLTRFLDFLCEKGRLLVIEPQPWKCYRNAVRRMKKSANELFPLFAGLEIRHDVDSQIENIILRNKTFIKIHETFSSEWSRKLYFFKQKDIS